jgi:hypothetical protein
VRKLLFLFIFLALAVLLSAQQVTITEVRGKVEVLAPGRSWTAATAGMQLARSAVVSTGFNSTAVLESELSTLEVKPLTRIRIDELVQQQDGARTEVFLQVGRVRADVRTAEGLRHDFQLRSPVSTAAVRGTRFEYSGTKLKVDDGSVRYSNQYNQSRTVSGGEQSGTSGKSSPQSGEGGRISQTTVTSRVTAGGGKPSAGDGTGALGDLDDDGAPELFGSIVVRTHGLF